MVMAEMTNMVLMFCALLVVAGLKANAKPYDYSASIECLRKPEDPQYKGGIIENPELNHGLKGWSVFGGSKIEHREFEGNKFIVAYKRNQSFDSFSQNIHLFTNHLYTFSAWVQVNEGNAQVSAVLKTRTGYKHAGSTIAHSKCWSFLKGGLTVDQSGPAQLYFESNNTMVELWVDNVSLKPFTQEQWKAHQDQTIEKIRKSRVRIEAKDKEGKPLSNATISLQQVRPNFPVGCAINKNILNNPPYQNWFTSRFTTTVFENELKWYSTESSPGNFDYSIPDSMIQFAKQNKIAVRGHNVLWDDQSYNPNWVKSLASNQLMTAANQRLNSVMSRYRGELIAWDVENENLHFSFFESKLGENVSGLIYNWAKNVDGLTDLFLNEYSTIETSHAGAASPANYLEKLNLIKSFPGNGDIRFGIGLESHFNVPNIPYMRSAIDTLASAGYPIWLTEVDVGNIPNQGNAQVSAVLKTRTGYKHAGSTIAHSKCWSFLKGGLTVDQSGPAQLYFESNNTMVELWVDNVSLKPFTQEQWKAHQDQTIEKIRKSRVRIEAKDKEGKPLSNVTISLQQVRPNFPVGCAINKNILNNPPYQNWFTSRFTTTVFENELKWYSTESSPGNFDYSIPDSMIQFAKLNKIAVRGHNVLWDDQSSNPNWVKSLASNQLMTAANQRLNSVMSRYRGELIAWDVENENLHFSFFESKLGENVSGLIYNWAKNVDGLTDLFLNEYSTIETSHAGAASPANYLEKLNFIKSFPGNGDIRFGIGLESHFNVPNIPYMRSAIDTLASAGYPIWLTEVDVGNIPNQAIYLEQILREAFSHPKVNGIVIWSAWSPTGCWRMCLTDNNFINLPTGDVVDKLLKEWGIKGSITATTDSNGFMETSLFHGDYEFQISHPSVTNFSLNARKFSVGPSQEAESFHLLVQLEV